MRLICGRIASDRMHRFVKLARCFVFSYKRHSIASRRMPLHCNPLFLDNLHFEHFEHFVKGFNLELWLDSFDELFAMEIVQEKGTSGTRLIASDHMHRFVHRARDVRGEGRCCDAIDPVSRRPRTSSVSSSAFALPSRPGVGHRDANYSSTRAKTARATRCLFCQTIRFGGGTRCLSNCALPAIGRFTRVL